MSPAPVSPVARRAGTEVQVAGLIVPLSFQKLFDARSVRFGVGDGAAEVLDGHCCVAVGATAQIPGSPSSR